MFFALLVSLSVLLVLLHHLITAFLIVYPGIVITLTIGLYLLKNTNNHLIPTLVVLFALAGLNATYQYMGGAYFTPQVMWWALFPIAANFFIGMRTAKFVTGLFIALNIFLYFQLTDNGGKLPHGMTPNQLDQHFLFDGIAVLLISFIFTYIYALSQRINEKQLEAARMEAIEASKTKSLFLANMSHEIRTPMNGVIGMTDVVLENKNLAPEVRAQLEVIKHCGDTLLNIINDILDVSKMEAGHFRILNDNFNLHSFLNEIESIFVKQLRDKKLKFDLSIDSNVPVYVFFDSNRLSQIIMNLLSNALKFTEEGAVKLKVYVGETNDNGYELFFEVHDTGPGIPLNVQKSLFNNYVQGEAHMSRKYGGTGLGLVICKRLANLMGGDITFSSKINEGSVFKFSVFIEEGEAELASA